MSTYTKFSRLSLAAKIKRAKNLQAKYFTGENIPIYGIPQSVSTLFEYLPWSSLHQLPHSQEASGWNTSTLKLYMVYTAQIRLLRT